MDQLKSLTETAAIAGKMSGGRGKYARTPDFTAPSSGSTRPRSDRGTTFHFSHKVISKNNDISENNHTQTTSAAHQGYIERPSATAQTDEGIERSILDRPKPEIEDGLIADGYEYPPRALDSGRASFGTLGTTKADRKRFWNDVEHHEPGRSRVQSRIIAELPHEIPDAERASIACDFCQVFEERGLPYWATIHKPGKRNNDKNYHLHITYFDRPSGKNMTGAWSHAHTETRKKKSRHTYTTRPDVSGKHPDTRLRDWPRRLRRNYADMANFHLAASNHEKRYDPRSYKDSGIEKEPGEHLGNKLSALESMGLDTEPGRRNAKKEIRWKINRAESPWMERYHEFTTPDSDLSSIPDDGREELGTIMQAGISAARKSASLEIVSTLLTRRMSIREKFLGAEMARLSQQDDMANLADRSTAIISLSSEREILDDASSSLNETARKTLHEKHRQDEMNSKLLQEFDRKKRILSPDLIFDGEIGTEMDDLPDRGEAHDRDDPFDSDDMREIDALFGEKSSGRETDTRRGRRDPLTHIEQVIRHIAEAPDESDSKAGAPHEPQNFPEAWAIKPSASKDDTKELDATLAGLDNRSLRRAAIATRDAADLSNGQQTRSDFARGWGVLRLEAERRGVDLDTGHHRPETASDPERAALHRDEEDCPIRVVRKTIERQAVL